ncbi:MAG TPA: hypothetical protein DCS93_41505 [Microscillaceae bacterium]|nr:hypothetical protein [Microscillaceae bacterium]
MDILKKKCLVTGATGFLGTNLVHELVKTNQWEVRASGMHGSETKYIRDLPIEIAFADITKPEEVDKIVKGCEVVFHVAGDTTNWNRLVKRQRKINIDGTMNIAKACHYHGVKRLIHTSTMDVLGHSPEKMPFGEDGGTARFTNMNYQYGESKTEGERQLRAFCDEKEMDYVVVYPGFMMGPFDFTFQLGRLFFDLKNNKMPGYITGGSSFCHVAEVAKAHITAALKGKQGDGYLLAGSRQTILTHKEVWEKMGDAVQAKRMKATLPRWLMIMYGYYAEFIANFTKKYPDINPGLARYMTCYQYCVSDKAIQELDYKVPQLSQCIQDALEWYQKNGFIDEHFHLQVAKA